TKVKSATAKIAAGFRRSRCQASAEELRPACRFVGATSGGGSFETSTAKAMRTCSLPVQSEGAPWLPDTSGRPNPAFGGGTRDERHHLACHLERLGSVFVGVRGRYQEQALLRRLDDHAAFQE